MGEKGNPLDFVGELPSSVLASLPDIAKAYRDWREKEEQEEAGINTPDASPPASMAT